MIELQTNENMTVQLLGEDGIIYDDPWYRYHECTHHSQAIRYYLTWFEVIYDIGSLSI